MGLATRVRSLLFISPHFPPDATAGAHRARVLAPYLEAHGWRPTVLTVDSRDYEGLLDDELGERVPAGLDVVRCRAWSPQSTRRVGLGDLGFRSFTALWRASRGIVERARPHAVYITTYPTYPALIGPWLAKRFGVPFVLDLQDPWTGAWGQTVGGGPDGEVDMKSRVSRALARRLERYVVPRASGLTGVSTTLLKELGDRYPSAAVRPRAVLPIGIDPDDMAYARAHEHPAPWLPSRDGRLHICYVGTALPLGFDVIATVFAALAQVRATEPDLAARIQFHFVGTSNEARDDAAVRVMPLATRAGVSDLVREHPPRVPFFDALRVLDRASVILLAGTTEARYTASKLHGALAAGRPILGVFHHASDVTRTLAPLASRTPSVRLLTYNETRPVVTLVEDLTTVLAQWAVAHPDDPTGIDDQDAALAPALAGRLAVILNEVVNARG